MGGKRRNMLKAKRARLEGRGAVGMVAGRHNVRRAATIDRMESRAAGMAGQRLCYPDPIR